MLFFLCQKRGIIHPGKAEGWLVAVVSENEIMMMIMSVIMMIMSVQEEEEEEEEVTGV